MLGKGQLKDSYDQYVLELKNVQKELNRLEDIVKESADKSSILNHEFVSLEYVLKRINQKNDNCKKILICGYYGAKNLGDELMLRALLNILGRSKHKVKVTIMLSNNECLDLDTYYPYEVIHYPKRCVDFQILAEDYDVFIWGGGAVIDDSCYEFRGFYNDLSYVLMRLSLMFLKRQKKVCALGVSANRFLSNQSYIQDLKTIIRNSEIFTLRDINSRDTLKLAGVETKTIKIIDDLALYDIQNDLTDTHVNTPKDRYTIGLILMFFQDNNRKIIELTNKILSAYSDKNIYIKFISFFETGDGGDYHDFQEIVKQCKIPEGQYEFVNFTDNRRELLKVFLSCNLIVSMRYHGALLSAICDIPTLIVNCQSIHRHYYNKMKYIQEHYNPNVLAVDFDDVSAYDEILAKSAQIKPTSHRKSCNKISKTLEEVRESLENLFKQA